MTTSVYIHIPFCNDLCTYCDFCKRYYNEKVVNRYLEGLSSEIKEKYQKEKIKTLYIGGGTPSSLSLNLLKKLFAILSVFTFDKDYEFTFEINPESITKEKLLLLKKFGVNRLSVGVETTNKKFLKYLNRHHDFSLVKEKIKLMQELGFKNINVDLIYALPKENLHDLEKDLDNIMSLNINHISTYSLEIYKHTILGIKKTKNINDELDSEMYYFICEYLKNKGFDHYEISNFCKNNLYSRHNLVYWHNEEYYGFGLGAASYLDNIRYTNTRSMFNYLKGERIIDKEIINKEDKLSYELILGFRLIKGINKKEFKDKYGVLLIDQFNIKELIKKKYLVDDGFNIFVSYDKLYVENSILDNFV